MCIYIYIYIYMYSNNNITTVITLLAQDKGGPSKGSFLNNTLCSYTDLCVCNDINGMCK